MLDEALKHNTYYGASPCDRWAALLKILGFGISTL